jgi:hypothetical protein
MGILMSMVDGQCNIVFLDKIIEEIPYELVLGNFIPFCVSHKICAYNYKVTYGSNKFLA